MADVAEIDGEQIDDIAKVDNCDVPVDDTLAHDTRDITPFSAGVSGLGFNGDHGQVWAGLDAIPDTMKTADLNCSDPSMVEASLVIFARSPGVNEVKVQLVLDGVEQGETGFLPVGNFIVEELSGSKACAGVITVLATATGTGASQCWVINGGHVGGYSVKLV